MFVKSLQMHMLYACREKILDLYSRIIPESIRWHVTHNRHHDALKTAAKIAKFNKIALSSDLDIEVTTNICGKKPSDYNIIDLFRTKIIRKRSIIMFYIWYVLYYIDNIFLSY